MNLRNIRWINFVDNIDERGRLTSIEGEDTIPFMIKRVFYVHQVHDKVKRGGHAHRDTDQVLSALNGSLDIIISDGVQSIKYSLDNPGKGLLVPRMLWVSMLNFSAGAVCLVFANTNYDRSKSIRTWAQYLENQGLPYKEEPSEGMPSGVESTV
jgi:hypothetical protein